jgi:hypothetical protein
MFGAGTYRIVSRIRRNLDNSWNVDFLCFFAEQIDYPPHQLRAHSGSREHGLVFSDDICTDEPREVALGDPGARSSALGFVISTSGLNAATRATSTEVSITPLRACTRCFGGNRDLRSGSRGLALVLYRSKNILFADISKINCSFTKRV